MTITATAPFDPKPQLRKTMGFWDVLLFNIATVLGPRWIAAAGHNGTSSISLWVLAAVFFFVPGALVINELSSRFPEEGGLYVWSREAFGPFHGFIAGWTYWIYTVFYFPGLLLASASMAAYIMGGGGAALAHEAGDRLPPLPGHLGQEELDGDALVEVQVVRGDDDPHASDPQHALHAVLAHQHVAGCDGSLRLALVGHGAKP